MIDESTPDKASLTPQTCSHAKAKSRLLGRWLTSLGTLLVRQLYMLLNWLPILLCSGPLGTCCCARTRPGGVQWEHWRPLCTAAPDAHGIDLGSGAGTCTGRGGVLMEDKRWALLYVSIATSVLALVAIFLLTRSALLESLLARLLNRAIRGPSFDAGANTGRRCRVERKRGGDSPDIAVYCSTPNLWSSSQACIPGS